jgi:hypothetical protein
VWADGFYAIAQRVALLPGIDHERFCRLQVLPSMVESAFGLGRQAAFDFNRPQAMPSAQFQHQVDLHPGGGAVEAGLGSFRRGAVARPESTSEVPESASSKGVRKRP